MLRRVIKLDRDIHSLGLQVPHAACYVIGEAQLARIVDPDELRPARQSATEQPATEQPATEEPRERLILLALPEADDVAIRTPDGLLTHYLRLLFHARVHLALEQRVAAGRLGDAGLRDRICRLGQTAFEEARAILRLDDLLLPPHDDLQVYIELAAVFLELERFAPELLLEYFPAIRDPQAAAALFAQDVADDEMLAALRRRDPPPPLDASDGACWETSVETPATASAVLPPIDLVSPTSSAGTAEAAISLPAKTAEPTRVPPASTTARVDVLEGGARHGAPAKAAPPCPAERGGREPRPGGNPSRACGTSRSQAVARPTRRRNRRGRSL